MELGVITLVEVDEDLSPGERLRQVVEEAVLAEQVGLPVFGVGERGAGGRASAPAVVLATIAGRTERLTLSGTVGRLGPADPVRVLRDFATLDLLSCGRAEVLAGSGTPVPPGQDGTGDDHREEGLELLLALRDEGSTTGRPLPVWLATGGTPDAVVRAGTLGVPMALVAAGGPWASAAPHADLYRRALDYGGHDVATPLAVRAHGYVCVDETAGREEFLPPYRRDVAAAGSEHGRGPMSDAAVEALLAPEGALFFGHPERVADKIVALATTLGAQRFELHASHVGHAATMRSVELLGTQVAPLVAERLAGR